jgi:hypothetical protein
VEQENKQENKIIKTTLKELGQSMPLGIISHNGAYAKSFNIKKWRMKEERELGEMRDGNRGESVAQFVSRVVSAMCTNVGTYNFENLKDVERLVHISQMFIGDVFYLYVWLRVKSMGDKLNLNVKCHNCSNSFKYAANLTTVEVNSCETYEDAQWTYKLEEPFIIRGKRVESFTMGPPRWTTLENMSGIGGMNTGAAKAGMILGSIIGINEEKDDNGKINQIVLTLNELDDMCKADIEGIANSLDDNVIGPNMAIEGACPKCRSNFVMPIDWSFDNFFGVSSR